MPERRINKSGSQVKILFLYTELAGYFLSCIEELLKENVEAHIIRWPVNNEAPFNFNFSEKIKLYERADYSSEQLISLSKQISPDIIYCSGWIDKGYLNVCRKFKNKIPVIVGFDNQWKGSLKQYIASLIGRFTILKSFNYCWVPGELQYKYAHKLGFKNEKILTGFYSCDYDFFHKQFLLNKENKKNNFPKKFIYVGRYYEFKGVKDLWNAFTDLQKEFPNNWELWCLGVGDIEPVNHSKIKHFGFVQPSEMPHFIKNTGVFILPSHFEPWGVVLHEFASAGFSLICSDEVGARTAFLKNGYNGYIYKAGNKNELKDLMKKIIQTSDKKLLEMGERSRELASSITPKKWVSTLLSVLK